MNKKKIQILEAAKLLFHTKGFAETSITDIITLANVSKGTFYNHFESKNNCFLAVLFDIHQKTILNRKLIYNANNPFEIETLIKELVSLHLILTENDLFDIMFQIINNKDSLEIFKTIEKQTFYELGWLANRLVEIYGKKIIPLAYDHAALLLGTIQFMYRTLSTLQFSQTLPPIQTIIECIIKKLEPIISEPTNDIILLNSMFLSEKNIEAIHPKISLADIIEELEDFYLTNKELFSEKNTELTQALLHILKETPNKKYIIETITNSFAQSFSKSTFEKEVFNIYTDVLYWLE